MLRYVQAGKQERFEKLAFFAVSGVNDCPMFQAIHSVHDNHPAQGADYIIMERSIQALQSPTFRECSFLCFPL